jgi:S-adenosylmethionine decarboxylase
MEDKEFMRMMLYRAAKECNSTLLNLSVHKFEPQGLTGIAMLGESHISVHTWPEKGMAVCDAFTCGDHTTPEKGVEYMKETLEASDIIVNEFVRPLE